MRSVRFAVLFAWKKVLGKLIKKLKKSMLSFTALITAILSKNPHTAKLVPYLPRFRSSQNKNNIPLIGLIMVIAATTIGVLFSLVFLLVTAFSALFSTPSDTFVQSRFNAHAVSARLPAAQMSTNLAATANAAQVSVSRQNSSLSFAIPLNQPTLKTDDKTVTFSTENGLIDVEYQLLKNGIKEDIILYSDPHTNLFPSELQLTNLFPYTTADQHIVFFDRNGEYQFHFEAPYAIDAAGNKTYAAKYHLKEVSEEASKQVSEEVQEKHANSQSTHTASLTQITKSLLSPLDTDLTANQQNIPRFGRQTTSYQLVIEVSSDWLNSPDRVYPIRIDPTVVHDQSSQFANGDFNRTLDTGSGSNPFIETFYQEKGLDQHTVGYWKMNETSGTTVADATANANNGTASNTTIETSKPGFGNARGFNGSNSQINLGNPASLRLTGDKTLSMWLYPTSYAQRRNPYAKAYGGEGTITHEMNGTLNYYYGTAGGNASPYQGFNSNVALELNTWSHIAVVRDLTNMQLYWYINGELTNQESANYSSAATSSLSALIGNGYTNSYAGRIDEVRIDSTARTPAEIKAMAERRPYGIFTSDVIDLGPDMVMNLDSLAWDEFGSATGDGETPYDDTGLVAQWNFNETSGTTLTNTAGSCGSSCNGTLTNFETTTGQDTIYVVEAFTDVGTDSWTVPDGVSEVDVLIVGGGGGGGGKSLGNLGIGAGTAGGGGGGGGGVIFEEDLSVTPQDTISITVGAGGPGGGPQSSTGIIHGTNGEDSIAFGMTAFGGGRGGGNGGLGANGGSGGGNATSGSARSGVSGQGNNGGTTSNTDPWPRGGGGGAGNSGGNGSGTKAGNGGSGLYFGDIFGENYGQNGWFAGGGGGSVRNYSNSSRGFGGIGGGTNGGIRSEHNVIMAPALANSGGGGGGQGGDFRNGLGAASSGGSGIVLIRYAKPAPFVEPSQPYHFIEYNSGWTADNSRWGGGALMFNGSNNYIQIPATGNLDLQNLTIESWAYSPDFSSNMFIFEKSTNGNVNTQYSCFFQASNNSIIFRTHNTSSSQHNLQVDIQQAGIRNSSWNHVVCSYNGSAKKIFVNGNEVASASYSQTLITNPAGPSRIGAHLGNNYYFNGIIDTTRIYNRALSPAEILANYNASRIQFETRTSPDGSTWEEWRPTGNTTQIDPLDSLANVDSLGNLEISSSSMPKTEGSNSLQVDNSTFYPDQSSLFGHWPLDETGGAGAYLKDISGNNNHGTPTGTSVVQGISGNARSGNGSSDYIQVPSEPLSHGTLEFWLNISPAQTWGNRFDIVSGQQSGGNGRFLLYRLDSSTLRYHHTFNGSTSTINISNANSRLVGSWNHIAMVFSDSNNDGEMSLYINGELEGNTSISNTYNTSNTTFTFLSDRGSQHFSNASIDEIKFHTDALSSSQINQIYQLGKNSKVIIDTNSLNLSNQDYIQFDIAADRPGTYLHSFIENPNTDYTVEAFTNTGNHTWTVPDGVSEVDVLVVGGGGGGGGRADSGERGSGGGGAGGLLFAKSLFVENQTIPIMVGSGGSNRNNGQDSQFNDLIAIGGGRGGTGRGQAPASGGSGGGAGWSTSDSGASGTAGQGNSGGNDTGGTNSAGAGGGASAPGEDATPTGDGARGGDGLSEVTIGGTTYSFADLFGTDFGELHNGEIYFAGGGGGNPAQNQGSDPVGPGGLGGGADSAGQGTLNGRNATPNTGGGGGGGGRNNGPLSGTGTGGSGGSGIVLLRYKINPARTPITIDFGAKLDSGNLIDNSSDLSFTIDGTVYGLAEKGSNISPGETIIVRENYDGTEYIAQGVVATVNESTGAVTVQSWDSASTFPSGGFSQHADVFKWQRIYWNIAEYDPSLRANIDSIHFTLTNGHEGRNIWIDNIQSSSGALSDHTGSPPTSTPNRYFQYRAIFSSWDTAVSAGLESVTLEYTVNEPPNTPSLDSPAHTATGVSTTPTLQTTATDPDNDYIRYRITLCEDSSMSSNCQTFDQTSSQTGWSGQNTQSSTAYTSGTQASYTLQSSLAVNTTYYWKSEAIDPAGTNTWSDTQATPYSFTTRPNSPPTAPTGLEVNGATNPTNVLTLSPTFTAMYSDPDGDPASQFYIQVSTSPSFAPGFANWSAVISPALASGSRSSSITYDGPPLSLDGTTYYWRIRFADNLGALGPWSSETATFTMYDLKSSTQCTLEKATDNSFFMLIWDNLTADPDSHEIERRVNAGSWTALSTELGTANSYQDPSIANGNTYQYRVRATKGAHSSEWCTTAALTPDVGNLRFMGM